jgi:uncharacterized membrane protein
MPFKLGPLELILMLPMLLVGAAIYFLPTILANARHRPNTMTIFLIDLLLGWTGIGWVVAMVMVFVEPGATTPATESALEIARQRYARGEIDKAAFEDIKRNIS